MGFKTAAMALREDSFDIDDPHLMAEEKLAVVLGTEGDGLASETIADCDYTVCIPMAHGVDSLNVAAASAVAFLAAGKTLIFKRVSVFYDLAFRFSLPYPSDEKKAADTGSRFCL